MTGPKVDIGRDLTCFVSSQAGFKVTDVAGESYPEAADANRIITGSAGGTIAYVPREDKFGTATAVPGVQQKRTAEGSIEGYVLPSGTRTTPPDMSEMLTTSGWTIVDRSATTTTVAGGASTAQRVDLTSSAGFAVGDAVIVEDTVAGTGLYEMRRITGVDTVGTDITVEPPLSFAPAAAANVKGAIAYKPNDTRDTAEDALCLWLMNNNSADRLGGWTPGTLALTAGGEDAARFVLSGTARRHDRLFQTSLNGAINNAVTTITVHDGLASAGDLLNTYWQIDDEVFKVTGVSGTTWTVATRGSTGLGGGAASHSDGAAMYPYQPAGTYAGSPVPRTSGQAMFATDGSATGVELQVNQASVACGLGVTYREDIHGDAYKVGGYVLAQREIRATLSGWTLKDENMKAAMQAWQTTDIAGASSQQISVAVVSGRSEGNMFGWCAPRVRAEDLSLDRGADEVTLDLTGLCEGTSAGADEIILMFG